MSLWGDQEVTGANTGSLTIDANGSVIGIGADFTTELSVGNYIRANGVEYRVTAVTDANTATVVAGTLGGVIAPCTANTFTVSTKPIYTSASSVAENAADVYFVDQTEVANANNEAKGLGTHSGWVKYTTYVDAQSQTRHKSEVLVAMNRTAAQAGDAEDTVTE